MRVLSLMLTLTLIPILKTLSSHCLMKVKIPRMKLSKSRSKLLLKRDSVKLNFSRLKSRSLLKKLSKSQPLLLWFHFLNMLMLALTLVQLNTLMLELALLFLQLLPAQSHLHTFNPQYQLLLSLLRSSS
ncbi:hypothetical protein DL95DRAFT_390213, partial [Leptodontidium sp. 2 PMI_412]